MSARARYHKEEESYFVSMTDMMVGLLFIFIIMLMYFALQFQATTKALVSADDTRTAILEEIKQSLAEQGVQIQIFPESGVLRLPDEILFEKGAMEPKPQGREALQKLALALQAIIPCYAINPAGPPPVTCKSSPHRIELLYIEGHTDNDRVVNTTARKLDNWDLSTERARNTRKILEENAPVLRDLISAPLGEPDSAPILAHVGQADTRPVAKGDDEESKSQNRRIDLRIIMVKPKPEEVEQIERDLAVAP
jgi:flagellar motor protein MotB